MPYGVPELYFCSARRSPPRIEPELCLRKITISSAQCNKLDVIVVLLASTRSPPLDPLLAFNGGPSGTSTDMALAPQSLRARHLLHRPKGTGESESLDCASNDPDRLRLLSEAIE